MTKRFFRGAAGAAALTGLALALACGGSDDNNTSTPPASAARPGTPAVTISGGGQAVTRHQYTVAAADYSGAATSFAASANNGGSVTQLAGSINQWLYVPSKAGEEQISVTAKNGNESSIPYTQFVTVRENTVPRLRGWNGSTGKYGAFNVAIGRSSSLDLASVDGDGDTVTWGNPAHDFGTAGTATKDAAGKLVIALNDTADSDKTYEVKITHTETYGGYTVYTFDHVLPVRVSSGGAEGSEEWEQGIARGTIQTDIIRETAVTGVPWRRQFNAGDPYMQSNEIEHWYVNGGVGSVNPNGLNQKPVRSWIGQPSNEPFQRPPVFELGPAFERWRLAKDVRTGIMNNDQRNFNGGRMYFVAPEIGEDPIYGLDLAPGQYYYFPGHFSSDLDVGVVATFTNTDDAGRMIYGYKNFILTVEANEPPSLAGNANVDLSSTSGKFEITVLNKRSDETLPNGVPQNVPWVDKYNGHQRAANEAGITYKAESALVYKIDAAAAQNYSYNMSAKIDLTNVAFTDPEFMTHGDILTFVLDGVTYGKHLGRYSDWWDITYDVDGTIISSTLMQGAPNYRDDLLNKPAEGETPAFTSKWDVTSVVQKYLARPYPFVGREGSGPGEVGDFSTADAARTYTGEIYQDDDNYEVGGKYDGLSIYEAHSGPGGYNQRGNQVARPNADGTQVTLGYLEFLQVPRVSEFTVASGDAARTLTGGEGLTFHYTAIDLGGNRVPFDVFVPTRNNLEPTIDSQPNWTATATSWTTSKGDVRGLRLPTPAEIWADNQPSEETQTTWRIAWNSDAAGITPASLYLADRPYLATTPVTDHVEGQAVQANADPVYLMIPNTPATQVEHTGPQVRFGVGQDVVRTPTTGAFTFDWTPSIYQSRKDYRYEIFGWDKYGAGMRPFKMVGKVYGTLDGTPVVKTFYDNGAPKTTNEADLTVAGWARVSINPFFNHTDYPIENRVYNQYGFDADQSWLSAPDRTTGKSWYVLVVPPNAPLLVSAARTAAGSGLPLDKPFVGPAVLSDDLTAAGSDFLSIDDDFDDIVDEAHKVTWETGNLISYAYIDPMSAESSAAATDPAQRVKIDLTAFVGSGALIRNLDESLTDPGNTAAGYASVNAPVEWHASGAATFDYKGYMHKVGASGLIKGDDVLQVVMPSVGQSQFFDVGPASSVSFPSAHYYPEGRLGWFGTLLEAKSSKDANLGLNYEPIVLPVYDGTGVDPLGLPYTFHIGEGGDPNYTLLALKKYLPTEGKYYANSTAPSAPAPYPYWMVKNTGVPARFTDPADGFDNIDRAALAADPASTVAVESITHESDWDNPRENFATRFKAEVNRDSFSSWLGRLQPYPSSDANKVNVANVTDTLQVVSYVSGTSLGPDNHQGLPVFVEFGNLNASPNRAGITADSAGKFAGRYDFGLIDIPKPEVWHTPIEGEFSAPVVSYIATYSIPTAAGAPFPPSQGLRGTMGLISADIDRGVSLSAVTPAFAPITQLKITNGILNGAGTSSDRRGTAVSNFISAYNNNNGVLTDAATYGSDAGIPVGAYNDGGVTAVGHSKVWLSWVNPTPANSISGNIIEFFDVSAAVTPSDTPLFKVYVGPSISAFPIPDAWLPKLGFLGADGAQFTGGPTAVAVRVRTVRYGDAGSGTLVNFDKTPFKQALPAVWMDTLSAPLDFSKVSATNTVIATESQWEGFKNGAGISANATTQASPMAVAGGFFSLIGDATDGATGTLNLLGTFFGASNAFGANSPGTNDTSITWSATVEDAPAGAVADISTDDTITLGNYSGVSIWPSFDPSDGKLSVRISDTSAAESGTPGTGDTTTVTFSIRLTATYTLGGAGGPTRQASTVIYFQGITTH